MSSDRQKSDTNMTKSGQKHSDFVHSVKIFIEWSD